MTDTLLLNFLYRTTPGRAILKVLIQPEISKIGGLFLNSRFSKPMIPYYISKYKIDMRGIEIPDNGFKSFNAFFTRKKKVTKKGTRPDCLVSPCDGFLSCIPIRRDTVFDVKQSKYTVQSLLQDDELAKEFYNGMALVFRLTPANYHRYMYIADGRIVGEKKIDGLLHCVRPVATRTLPVFTENSREYQVIDTERFGKIVQMEVGALMVGKITNNKQYQVDSIVWTGDEKGYFEFGGSTIILLFKEDILELLPSLSKRKDKKGEVAIKMGEVIAKTR